MSIALRPLSTGQVLDRTFVLYRKHFFLFTGIAIVQVAFFVAGIAVLFLFGKFMPAEFFGGTGAVFFFSPACFIWQ